MRRVRPHQQRAEARFDAVDRVEYEADTSATTRLVTFGAVLAVRTVVFITSIHSSTGSGVAADTGRD